MKNKNSFLNYFRPSIYLENFDKLNLFALINQDINVLFCDLDNTLVPHFSRKPNNRVISFLNKVKNHGIQVWIISNNSKKRVVEFCDTLKKSNIINGYIWNAKKPLTHKIKKHMKKNRILSENVIFLGDQLITDIFVANRLGCKSILVHPLMEVVYDLNTGNRKLQSILESMIYSKLEQNNFLNITPINEEFINSANEIL
ncbi:YqeG family HAD IIIA-type phosphatase [Mycoplasmoides pirum]|uniref:YqeG family HAD IIIA-type phosphatase n=1 Tax=Mycoplasmoides pirum TaxID=2122 RepID=UPI00047FCBE4|nr:HAD-IIIA family hydrolase [Mycoplasmoides pirum]